MLYLPLKPFFKVNLSITLLNVILGIGPIVNNYIVLQRPAELSIRYDMSRILKFKPWRSPDKRWHLKFWETTSPRDPQGLRGKTRTPEQRLFWLLDRSSLGATASFVKKTRTVHENELLCKQRRERLCSRGFGEEMLGSNKGTNSCLMQNWKRK